MSKLTVPNYLVGASNSTSSTAVSAYAPLYGDFYYVTQYSVYKLDNQQNRYLAEEHEANNKGVFCIYSKNSDDTGFRVNYFGNAPYNYTYYSSNGSISDQGTRGSTTWPVTNGYDIYARLYTNIPDYETVPPTGEYSLVHLKRGDAFHLAMQNLGLSDTDTPYTDSHDIGNVSMMGAEFNSMPYLKNSSFPSDVWIAGQDMSFLVLSQYLSNKYPITYRPTNCSFPNAPTEAAVGENVVVPVTFPDGYGIVNESNIYVTSNGVVIPSTYSNGQLTFTMPDPS